MYENIGLILTVVFPNWPSVLRQQNIKEAQLVRPQQNITSKIAGLFL
jgi:hypothetical protein